MAKRKGIRADELMRRLKANPKWVEENRARARRYAELGRLLDSDEAPLLAELAAEGIIVSSVFDFVNHDLFTESAAHVLVRHLKIKHHPRIRDGIIRSLSDPRAREIAFEALQDAYCSERRDLGMRWVLANAISTMATFDEVKDLPDIGQYADLFDKNV